MQILVIAGVVWFILAVVVALVVGAVIRNGDRQLPPDEQEPAFIPQQRQESPDLSEPRSAGRKPRTREQRWPYGRKYGS